MTSKQTYLAMTCGLLFGLFTTAQAQKTVIVESEQGGQNNQFYSEVNGSWEHSVSKSTAPGLNDEEVGSRFVQISSTPTKAEARVEPVLPQAGKYEIDTTWGRSGNAKNVKYVIQTPTETKSVYLDQDGWGIKGPSNANEWVSLGVYDLPAKGTVIRILTDESNGPLDPRNAYRVYVDAFRFAPPGEAKAADQASASPSTSTTTLPPLSSSSPIYGPGSLPLPPKTAMTKPASSESVGPFAKPAPSSPFPNATPSAHPSAAQPAKVSPFQPSTGTASASAPASPFTPGQAPPTTASSPSPFTAPAASAPQPASPFTAPPAAAAPSAPSGPSPFVGQQPSRPAPPASQPPASSSPFAAPAAAPATAPAASTGTGSPFAAPATGSPSPFAAPPSSSTAPGTAAPGTTSSPFTPQTPPTSSPFQPGTTQPAPSLPAAPPPAAAIAPSTGSPFAQSAGPFQASAAPGAPGAPPSSAPPASSTSPGAPSAQTAPAPSPAPTGLQWLDYDQALAQGKKLNRPIILYFASKSSVVRKFEQEVLDSPEVQKAFGKFVLARIPYPDSTKLVRFYGVAISPTFIFLGSDGYTRNRVDGVRPAEDYLAAARQLAR